MILLVPAAALALGACANNAGMSQEDAAAIKEQIEEVANRLDAVEAAWRAAGTLLDEHVDDHDITDDWNLSARWESTAYNHPFSRRIVGNALLAYMLCQGWGNRPDAFSGLLDAANALTNTTDQQDRLEPAAQDALTAAEANAVISSSSSTTTTMH